MSVKKRSGDLDIDSLDIDSILGDVSSGILGDSPSQVQPETQQLT